MRAYPLILCWRDFRDVTISGMRLAAPSPFVLTFAKIGITAAAALSTFVVLTAALSGCNSGMYSRGVCFTRWRKPSTAGGSRESSPRRAGRGRGALYFDFAGRLLPELHHPQLQRVFVTLYSASVLPGMVPWFVILISQLRFRRAHKEAIVIILFVPLCFRGRTI